MSFQERTGCVTFNEVGNPIVMLVDIVTLVLRKCWCKHSCGNWEGGMGAPWSPGQAWERNRCGGLNLQGNGRGDPPQIK